MHVLVVRGMSGRVEFQGAASIDVMVWRRKVTSQSPKELLVTVYDWDRFSSNDFMGGVRILSLSLNS